MISKFAPMLLASLGLASFTSTALAQGNTFNPYGNSGYSDYREFGNPMYSNNAALPGQSVLNRTPLISRPRANTFQDYNDDIDGLETSAARRGASANVPYFQAYQRMNSSMNRTYRANEKADQEFYERQRAREKKYAQAMAETDPVKRGKLLREAERDLVSSASGTKSATKGAATAKSATGATANAAPAARRSTAPTERRSSAPSPFANSPSSRSRAPSPLTGRSTAPPPLTSRPSTGSGTTRPRTAPESSTAPVPPPPR